jgi:hypothetical protein
LVYVELPPGNGGMMRDLSETGFSLRAMMPLRQSDKVPFSFSLDTSARVDGDAIVVRVGDDGRVAALEFAGLPVHSRDQIRSWLEKSEEPPPGEVEALKPAMPDNSSFDELRTEIRATSPRPWPVTEREPLAPTAVEPALLAEPEPAMVTPPVVTPETAPVVKHPEPPLRKWRLASARPESPPDVPKVAIRTAPAVPEAHESTPPSESDAPARPAMSLSTAPEEKPLVDEPAVVAKTESATTLALQPLSLLEGKTDAGVPGWVDRFTLGRAVSIMLVLTFLAGCFVFHRELGQALIWLGQKMAGEESAENSPTSRALPVQPPAQTPTPAPEAQSSEPASAANEEKSSQAASDQTPSNETTTAEIPKAAENAPTPQWKGSSPNALVPLTQTNRATSTPLTSEAGESGQQEYQQAEQILRTPEREAEVPEAVRLLWAAVEKGHTGAEISLAELFQTGRGVTKNCDQAKILLSAASRKGSAEARKRLDLVQRQGCGE